MRRQSSTSVHQVGLGEQMRWEVHGYLSPRGSGSVQSDSRSDPHARVPVHIQDDGHLRLRPPECPSAVSVDGRLKGRQLVPDGRRLVATHGTRVRPTFATDFRGPSQASACWQA